MLEIEKTASGYMVHVEGGGSFPLPRSDELKREAIQAAQDSSGDDSEAVRILMDCDFDFEVVPGKDEIEELIGIVITTSRENAAALEDPDNHALPEVMGALLEACPDIGSERIVPR